MIKKLRLHEYLGNETMKTEKMLRMMMMVEGGTDHLGKNATHVSNLQTRVRLFSHLGPGGHDVM